jgi:hypothetical protein
MSRFFGRWINHLFCAWSVFFCGWDVFWAVAFHEWFNWILVAFMAAAAIFQIRIIRRITAARRALAVDTFNEPVPPRNVRLAMTDGTVVPVELVYAGRGADGNHMWRGTAPVAGAGPGTQLLADMIPGHTAISIEGFLDR